MKLEADQGGDGDRLLVLLHGLGATRAVWQPMLAENRWDGRWIAPDLRGHGASAHAQSYALGLHAGDVAELAHGDWREIVVLGHSMGGAVALALASGWFGIMPARVFGLGIKVSWNEDALAGMRKLASAPVKFFATKDEAVARYLKVSGLAGLMSGETGVTHTKDGWRLAHDPAVAGIGAPPMMALTDAAAAPLHLARGTDDTLVTLDDLLDYDTRARDLPGGHNAMVEHPGVVWDWILSV